MVGALTQEETHIREFQNRITLPDRHLGHPEHRFDHSPLIDQEPEQDHTPDEGTDAVVHYAPSDRPHVRQRQHDRSLHRQPRCGGRLRRLPGASGRGRSGPQHLPWPLPSLPTGDHRPGGSGMAPSRPEALPALWTPRLVMVRRRGAGRSDVGTSFSYSREVRPEPDSRNEHRDLRAAGDRGPAPGRSGIPVPGGRLRHGHFHRQAPALDGARLQRVVAELDQGVLGRGPGESAGRRPFPWPTAGLDRAAAGVHPDGAVEGNEPAGTGQAPGGQPLDHPTGGRVESRVEITASAGSMASWQPDPVTLLNQSQNGTCIPTLHLEVHRPTEGKSCQSF